MSSDYKGVSFNKVDIGLANIQTLQEGAFAFQVYQVPLVMAQLIALDPSLSPLTDIPILPAPPPGKMYRIINVSLIATYNSIPLPPGTGDDLTLYYGHVDSGQLASSRVGPEVLQNLASPSPLQLISGVAGANPSATDTTLLINQPIVLNYANATSNPFTAGDASIVLKMWALLE